MWFKRKKKPEEESGLPPVQEAVAADKPEGDFAPEAETTPRRS